MKKLIKVLTFWIPIKKWRRKAQENLKKSLVNFIPLKKNWIIFYDTFSQNGNGDNIRPLAEELRRRHPDFKFFFVAKEKKEIEMADEVLIVGSKRFEEVLYQTKYLISPMDLPPFKRKGQIWVMTWHGAPIKKLYLDREDKPEFRQYVRPFQYIDIFCNSSPVYKKIYADSFNISQDIIKETGLPRNDILFHDKDSQIRNRIRKELGIPENKKALFYCPTWRRYDWKMPMPLNLDKLKKELGDEYCIMLRSHVGKHDWVDEKGNKITIGQDGFTFDVASYVDISGLYLAADVLISDYSSTIFDGGITAKPQIFYPFDLEDYKKEFQLNFDYDEFVPGAITQNTDELITAVKDLPNYETKYGEKYKKFRQTFCTYEDGCATTRVIDLMLEKD